MEAKRVSIVCSALSFIISFLLLVLGIGSINAEGLSRIGVIFIPPAVAMLIDVISNFLVTINKNGKGLIYSFISIILKAIVIIWFIPMAINEFAYEMKFGVSNFGFDLCAIGVLVVMSIPSVLNIIRLKKEKTL